ncbi:MAG: hypothetical protein RLZZ339_1299 [Cyanobacteriota bacterium]|jgi:hypothetical protein
MLHKLFSLLVPLSGESGKTHSKQRPKKERNLDLRSQCQSPALAIPQMVEELTQYLTPTLFASLKYLQGNHEKLMRNRLLNLPVMVALVLKQFRIWVKQTLNP